jgi:hypothetical protein
MERLVDGWKSNVQHGGNPPHYDADDQCHGNDRYQQDHGIEPSIRPGTAVPPNAVQLRWELATAFGSPCAPPRGDQGEVP